MLADALGDNAKAFLFAHVAPLEDNTAESLSTLTFAKRASEVTLGAPVKRVVKGPLVQGVELVACLQAPALQMRMVMRVGAGTVWNRTTGRRWS